MSTTRRGGPVALVVGALVVSSILTGAVTGVDLTDGPSAPSPALARPLRSAAAPTPGGPMGPGLVAPGSVAIRQPESAQATAPTEPQQPAQMGTTRASLRQALAGRLSSLQAALRGDSAAGPASLARPDDKPGRCWLRGLAANVDDLGMDRVSLALAPGSRGSGDTAEVRLGWSVAGIDSRTSIVSVPIGVRAEGDQVWLTTPGPQVAGAPGARLPLWWQQRIAVLRSAGVVVAAQDALLTKPLARLSRQARRHVQTVLPRWRGSVMVVAPGSAAAFARVTDSGPAGARAVAASTMPTDLGPGRDGPVRIVVNPRVFSALGPAAQRIVMTHEMTHVAVGAATTAMPIWMREGFADEVALLGTSIPATTLAAQALDRVRQRGVWDRLPRDSAFAARSAEVGAAYEAAWLAARRLARDLGRPSFHELYRRLDAGVGLGEALRAAGGPSPQVLTRRWQRELRRLAGCPRACS